MPIGSAFPLKNLPIRKEPSAVAGSVPFDEGAEAGTDGGLAEVVTVALHGQTVDADSHSFFPSAVIAVFGIAVIRGHLQDAVGDEVLAGAVALDDGMNQILRHILIIGEELLGVLGQAVAAIAEGRVVVIVADAGIQADAFDDAEARK